VATESPMISHLPSLASSNTSLGNSRSSNAMAWATAAGVSLMHPSSAVQTFVSIPSIFEIWSTRPWMPNAKRRGPRGSPCWMPDSEVR